MNNMDWKKILSFERLKTNQPYQEKLKEDIRNEFESDYGRIVFSPAVRRMHDKTQVFPLIADDKSYKTYNSLKFHQLILRE